MKRTFLAICCLSIAASAAVQAQEADSALGLPQGHLHGGGRVILPQSSKSSPQQLGLAAHTNYRIFVPPGREDGNGFADSEVNGNGTTSPIPGYYAETPASLACLYGLTRTNSFCNPIVLSNSNDAGGGSRAIALVDAYDYPTALSDLKAYSAKFGLPIPTASTFTVAWPGSKPSPDPACAIFGGFNCWAAEAALDIEMAHAAAPHAHIYLVEAKSSSGTDLFAAVSKAAALVQAAGGGEVSMSWGGGEFNGENTFDHIFNVNKVVMFASTGDSEGTQYPSVSPNVVAVGGTTVTRSPYTLDFEQEITWEDGGGGVSPFEPLPPFQSTLKNELPMRGVPDVAADANPRTGVWVYDSYENTYNGTLEPWNIFGGTSVASPLVAGIVNHAGLFSASSAKELALIYSTAAMRAAYGADYRDINYGTCGFYDGWYAGKGWDPCTGNGAPVGQAGK